MVNAVASELCFVLFLPYFHGIVLCINPTCGILFIYTTHIHLMTILLLSAIVPLTSGLGKLHDRTKCVNPRSKRCPEATASEKG